jgi:hypothetical protein
MSKNYRDEADGLSGDLGILKELDFASCHVPANDLSHSPDKSLSHKHNKKTISLILVDHIDILYKPMYPRFFKI